MVLIRLSFFYFSVNKKKEFYGTVMGQKIESDFGFKRLHLMYVNRFFRVLLDARCSAFFPDQKCVVKHISIA